jgi:hypothetical protein
VACPAAHAQLHGLVHALGPARRRVKRQAGLQERIQQDAERPGVGSAAVVGLAHDDLGGGVIVGAAAGFELLVGGDAAREAEVGEGNDGVGVGGPVG